MPEQTTIQVPKNMPLIERISGVSKEISRWLDSLEEPFNVDTDVIQLKKYERNDKYTYHYMIDREARGISKQHAHQKPIRAQGKANQ